MFSIDEIVLTAPLAEFVIGDVNLDGVFNVDDVPAFVAALLDYYTDPCDVSTADLTGDALVDGDDVQAFLDQLFGE